MTISFSPLRTSLHHEVQRVHSCKLELQKLEDQKELLTQLDQALRSELEDSPHQTFNWENHAENRALLDKIYDLDLLEGFEERIYAFTDPEQTMNFLRAISSGLENKASDVQQQTQLHHEKRQEMMQFYHQLQEIISKLSNIVSSVAARI